MNLLNTVLITVIGFCFCAPIAAIDRLAADEASAAYRTGVTDEIALSVPAEIQRALVKDAETGLAALAQFLTSDTADEFVKVKRLHDWITDNIAYDSDLLLGLSDQGSRKVADLVKFKRTTCGGYAGLFFKLATLAGLENEIVTGNSKTCWIKSSKRDCHHVWNAVKVRGKWYYVDTTADGRFTYKHGAFTPKKRYKDSYLFIHPHAKLLINLPLEERQQFMSPVVSREQYLKTPRVSVLYHKYAIAYSPETIAQFYEGKRDFEGGALQKVFDVADSPGEIFELRFRAPANVSLFPQLVRDTSEAFDDNSDSDKQQDAKDSNTYARAFCNRESAQQVVCQYSAPKPGRYKAYLQAKEAGDLHKFGLIHAFTLNAGKAGPVLPQNAAVLYPNALFNYQQFRILATDFLGTGGFPSIEVAKPVDGFITSFLFNADGKQVPAAVEYSFLSRERLKFYYKFPAAGSYWLRLQTRLPNETGAPLQNVAVVRLDMPSATAIKFPPLNDFILTRAFAEANLFFVDSNIVAGTGNVSFTAGGVSGQELECQLYNENSKAIAEGCTTSVNGDRATFVFNTAERGKYGGRIFLRDGGRRTILGFFKTER